jgi:signal transduction histidine kinase/tetratricopeptide (TPR) repeat protein
MTAKTLPLPYEPIDSPESHGDRITVIRHQQSGELFLLAPSHHSHGNDPLALDTGEQERTASLDHPNIARPAFSLEDAESRSVAYHYRKGQTLSAIFQTSGPLPPADALHIARQMLRALEYLHARGMVHGGVDPDTLYIDEGKNVLLLDFDAVTTADEAARRQNELPSGASPYRAPEQGGAQGLIVDSRTDLYCAGLVLYRMIAGKLPFDNQADEAVERPQRSPRTEVQPLRKVHGSINSILMKALKFAPGERYQTASGFKHDIIQAIDQVKNEKSGTFTPGIQDAVYSIDRTRVFIGRGRETDLLLEGISQFRQGRGVSVCLCGKSGMGKSETIRAFRRTAPIDDALVIDVRCSGQTPCLPMEAARRIVRAFIAIINRASAHDRESFAVRLAKIIGAGSVDACELFPDLRPFLKTAGPAGAAHGEREIGMLPQLLCRIFEAICGSKPVIITIDDLHWIDRLSFEALVRLIASDVPFMLVTTVHTHQPGGDLYVHDFDLRKSGIQKIVPLMALTRSEIRDFVSVKLGETPDLDAIVSLLVERTDCSPLMIAETLSFLVRESLLTINKDSWSLSATDHHRLPATFEIAAMISKKTERLAPHQREWLSAAALDEGKPSRDRIDRVLDVSPEQSTLLLERLEQAGFLAPQIEGGYDFPHHTVREAVRSLLSPDARFALYERFGSLYESLCGVDKRNLFLAAECFFKSKNLSKAMTLGYAAARYAVDCGALDLASRYFTNTQVMATQCSRAGIAPTIDTTALQMEFGRVLMKTGRGEQAAKLFETLLLEHPETEGDARIDIKNLLGDYYLKRGEIERAITLLSDAAVESGIRLPQNGISLQAALAKSTCTRIMAAMGLLTRLRKRRGAAAVRAVRTLNLLATAGTFTNGNLTRCARSKAIALASRLDDCPEKALATARYEFTAGTLLRSMRIAGTINRGDLEARAQSLLGCAEIRRGNWNAAERHLRNAIERYRSFGDNTGHRLPFAALTLLNLRKGQFPDCVALLEQARDRAPEHADACASAIGRIIATYVTFLTGRDSYVDWAALIEERATPPFNVPLMSALCDCIIANKLSFNNQLKNAFAVSSAAVATISKHRLQEEYTIAAVIDLCEILVKEYRNRTGDPEYQAQIELSDGALLKLLRRNAVRACWESLRFPSHRGAASRALAWYCALKKRHHFARRLFRAAIDRHHALDMRYEEAKSLREFALYLENRRQPGLARDCFTRAYLLFEQSGVIAECQRLRNKIDDELLAPELPATERREASSKGSTQAADQVRVDTLYDACKSLAHMESMDSLLRQIVFSLIKATGAQQGLLLLDGDDSHDARKLAVTFDNHLLSADAIAPAPRIIRLARAKGKVILSRDPAEMEATYEPDQEKEGSVLCVPLIRDEKYYGCVYLTNTLVVGLFSESSAKTAQILSAQASFLIENAYLMEEYKRLNARLEQKVQEQTRDICEKNDELLASNLKLVESERMKDLLSGTIVHDIKNYAAGISGNLKLLSYKYGGDPKTVRSIGIVNESCIDIVTLASNLLDIGKMEEGKFRLQARRIFFEELAAMAQKYQANILFEEKKVGVAIIRPRADFAIIADPYLVERMIQNLFSNAAKYSEAGGNVRLTFEESDGEFIVSLFSSGKPIAPDHQETIFEKYGRIDGKASQFSKGLGLFFCKGVMLAHQGRIWLETAEKGNMFRLGFKKI